MIKSITLIKRKPGLSREQFIHYYEEVHAPLAIKYFPTFKKYVRNYVIPLPGSKGPDFDCITEIWFEDIKAAMAVTAALGDYDTEIGRVFLRDEEKFMDRESRISFLVEERGDK
jgi:uncharacterized protein (TIGR02118 family)